MSSLPTRLFHNTWSLPFQSKSYLSEVTPQWLARVTLRVENPGSDSGHRMYPWSAEIFRCISQDVRAGCFEFGYKTPPLRRSGHEVSPLSVSWWQLILGRRRKFCFLQWSSTGHMSHTPGKTPCPCSWPTQNNLHGFGGREVILFSFGYFFFVWLVFLFVLGFVLLLFFKRKTKGHEVEWVERWEPLGSCQGWRKKRIKL